MSFSPDAYGPRVAAIIALDGNGERLMPLAYGTCSNAEALARLRAASARALFPHSRAPEAALAGLYLYFSCLEYCHEIAQKIPTAEGSYWHAIMHRQEPDAGNSAYWFRQVGEHPIYPELYRSAQALGYIEHPKWDPFAFIDYCEEARRKPGSEDERIAREVQRAEWQLLFDYCAVAAA